MNFGKGIEAEHCIFGGCDYEFETPNYKLKTTPKKEYEISTGKTPCVGRDLQDQNGKKVREIKSLEELKGLDLCRTAKLNDQEILSVVC